jgi:branched-chain amino acid transport system ATP-binding protein
MSGPALEVRDAVVSYSSVPVLHGVSLHALPGEVIAILGANGAGKTTLLRAISGLLALSAGQVLIAGSPVTHLPATHIARRGLAQCIETRGILPSLTVEENILLGMLGKGRASTRARQEAIETAIDFFPWIASRRRAYGGQLSGGQQQMVAIARALTASPSLLLLDEPSLGLAPNLVEEIYVAIRRLADGERTVIVVEQHVQKALSVANRAYVLRRGTVVLAGPSREFQDSDALSEAYLS